MKKRPLNFFTAIALFTLILIRPWVDNTNSWISCLNYFGLVIAVWGFLIEFSSRHKKNKAANFIKGILILILAVMIIIGCFIFVGIIKLDVVVNDEILLWTLLISLPVNYYCELLGQIVNKQSKKEHTYGTKGN